MSAPPQAIAPNPHTNLLNTYIQIANKMGFQQKNFKKYMKGVAYTVTVVTSIHTQQDAEHSYENYDKLPRLLTDVTVGSDKRNCHARISHFLTLPKVAFLSPSYVVAV
jgi:hypothetical protein